MEEKLEKIERVVPKIQMIEWLFYPTFLIMAMTFTTISTLTALIGSIAWVFASIVLVLHVILLQNDRMLLPYTDKISAMAFAIGLVLYGLTLSSKYSILFS